MRRNCIVLIPTISIFLQSAHDHRNSQSLHEWFNALYLCFCLGCKYFLGFAYTLYPSLPAPPWLPPIAFLVWKCLSSFPSLNPFFFLFSVCYLRFLLSLFCERFYSLESLFPWFPCRQAVKAAALWGAGQGWAVVVREKERERALHRPHRPAFVPSSSRTIPYVPANGTAQQRGTGARRIPNSRLLQTIHKLHVCAF